MTRYRIRKVSEVGFVPTNGINDGNLIELEPVNAEPEPHKCEAVFVRYGALMGRTECRWCAKLMQDPQADPVRREEKSDVGVVAKWLHDFPRERSAQFSYHEVAQQLINMGLDVDKLRGKK